MNTYTREISYLSKGFSEDKTSFVDKPAKVVATFKELSRTEEDQHPLAMMITRIMRKFRTILPDNKVEVDVDEEALLPLTKRYVKEMSVFTDQYDELKRNEILADAGALLRFGTWVLGEKIAPFFSALHET